MTRLGCILALLAAMLPPTRAPRAGQTFRTSVHGVGVTVSVRSRNAPVGGLSAADFELTDNLVAQTVTAVALETAPLDVTLVLDASGSMAGDALDAMKRDVRTITGMLRPDDRLRVVSFAARAIEVQPMQVRGDGRSAQSIEPSGATAFFHGLIAALLQPSAAGRPHLIVAISDGADNLSLLDGTDVRELARRSDAILHVVQRQQRSRSVRLILWGWFPFTGFAGLSDVREAAVSTGGRFMRQDVTRGLPEVFKQTLEDFRTGYVLWFTPTDVAAPGWHELSVKVKGSNYEILARRGYFGG
jgi:hypothetical protein